MAIGTGVIMGVIVSIITVALGSVIGLTMTASSVDVFNAMELSADANTAMNSTIATIYTSWPLLGLVVLALIGAVAISAFFVLQ